MQLWSNINWYNKPNYYNDIINKIKEYPNIKKVIIIGGIHIKTINVSESYKYVNKVKRMFESVGYPVELRLGQSPDEDFTIMSRSKYFVQSGGRFSRIISNLVKYNNGVVFKVF